MKIETTVIVPIGQALPVVGEVVPAVDPITSRLCDIKVTRLQNIKWIFRDGSSLLSVDVCGKKVKKKTAPANIKQMDVYDYLQNEMIG
ncbi:hypothetical protein ABE137_11185 [Brevibacillus laterosporus]|uniref:hypothetical protein n=1 Tax=Brevibacillus laterosporus TaxID=1465 RepID=UPI003D1C37E5